MERMPLNNTNSFPQSDSMASKQYFNPSQAKVNKIHSHNEEARPASSVSKLILYFINMIFFGVAILLFVVGIAYLTAYRYDYSFTSFSVNFIAGFFIAFSILLVAFATLNVIAIQTNKNIVLIMSSAFILILVISLFGIAIWGLVASTDDNLGEEIRKNMDLTLQGYRDNERDRFETLKFDWIQTRFNCCGINSYSDWRAFFLYGGSYKPVNYINQWSINNNLPYTDSVPDSCCVNKMYNCGKQYRNPASYDNNNYNQNSYQGYNSYQLDSQINVKGCLSIYLAQFSKDIVFLAGLAMGTSSLCLVIWFLLLCVLIVKKLRK